jgi:Mitochondrial carrier protein
MTFLQKKHQTEKDSNSNSNSNSSSSSTSTSSTSSTGSNDNNSTPTTTTSTKITFLSIACGSAMASIISRLCTHLFDTIKARIQIYNTTGSTRTRAGNRTGTTSTSILLQTQTYHSYGEAIKSLYRGLGVVIIGGTPGTMIYLCAYDIMKYQLSSLSSSIQSYNSKENNSHDNTNCNCNYNFIVHFISGMIAETIACTIYVPVDVIKERMQVQPIVLLADHPSVAGTNTATNMMNMRASLLLPQYI